MGGDVLVVVLPIVALVGLAMAAIWWLDRRARKTRPHKTGARKRRRR